MSPRTQFYLELIGWPLILILLAESFNAYWVPFAGLALCYLTRARCPACKWTVGRFGVFFLPYAPRYCRKCGHDLSN